MLVLCHVCIAREALDFWILLADAGRNLLVANGDVGIAFCGLEIGRRRHELGKNGGCCCNCSQYEQIAAIHDAVQVVVSRPL